MSFARSMRRSMQRESEKRSTKMLHIDVDMETGEITESLVSMEEATAVLERCEGPDSEFAMEYSGTGRKCIDPDGTIWYDEGDEIVMEGMLSSVSGVLADELRKSLVEV